MGESKERSGSAGPWDGTTVPHLPHTLVLLLAGGALVASALHLWPYQDSHVSQVLNIPNLVVALWSVLLLVCVLSQRNWEVAASLLPHVSVLAYLCLTILSIAFARDAARAVSFTAKLMLMYVAGYTLFRAALRDARSVRWMLRATVAAATLGITASLAGGYVADLDTFGFHESGHKYGTYMSTLASLGGTYLLVAPGWRRIAGAALITAAIFTSGTLGAVFALAVATALLGAISPGWTTRAWAWGVLGLGVTLSLTCGTTAGRLFRRDLGVWDADGLNAKQRYIEWQAEINLLEERTIAGTGAGSVNDHRSSYYHRLPKLNTLEAFDQNGWMTVAAETGILGLVAFCWMVGHHLKVAWRRITGILCLRSEEVTGRSMVAACTALVAASAAHVFSSVQFNGVLIAFAWVLALIGGVDRLQGGSQHALA